MSPKSCEHQNQNVVLYFVNQQPIRFNMAFSRTFEISGQFVILELGI